MLRAREAGQRILPDRSTDHAHPCKDGARLLGQEQEAQAPIRRVRAAHQPAGLFHAVDEPDKGDRLDLEDVGKPRLIDALFAREECKGAPLGAGEAKALGALVETLGKQPGHVVDDEAKSAVEFNIVHGDGYNKHCYNKQGRSGATFRLPPKSPAIDGLGGVP